MKLYHYSKEHYDELRTLEKQRPITREEKAKAIKDCLNSGHPGFYYEHISFFFDPIPYDILGKIFGKDHHTWFPGSRLFEYEIDVKQLGHFSYYIVETPESTELFYDDTISESEYYQKLDQLNKDKHYIGSGEKELIKASQSLIGSTREYYLKVKSRPNWDDIKNKYAATVPHVMVYPDKGIVKYDAVKEVTIK